MITNRQFWRSWALPQKTLFFISSFLLLAFCISLVVLSFMGNSLVLPWDVASELFQKPLATEAFVEKGLRFTNNELVYYVKEWFVPGVQVVNQWSAYILFGACLVGLSLSTAALSFLNSRWFLLAIVSISGFLLLSRLENVFQQSSKLPFLVSFFLSGGLLFAFNSFLKKVSLVWRFTSLLIVFCVIFGVGLFVQKVNEPIYAVAQYGLLFPVLVFAVFVFLIAHEGIALVVWASSNSSEKGKSSLNTYLILASFYLLNCLLIYLENTRSIDASGFVISPVWLFVFSAIAGIWGFKKKTEALEWFSFQQSGAWIYFGMAIISAAVLGYSFATGNDPLYELLLDYIAICHLAIGLIFFVHVLVNFIQLLRQGLNVDLVLYKPKFSRLLLAGVAGIFAVGFLLIQKNIYSYNQLNAALNNALGDYYFVAGDLTAAETFYKEGADFDYYNHKSNYALAGMARTVGDGVTASYYFKRAIQKNPSEQAFIALSQNLEGEDLYFESLFNLREGLKVFPESAYLASTMARTMEKANVRDSVYLYLNMANEQCFRCEVPKTNMLAFWIENALPAKLDSVKTGYEEMSYPGNVANQLAIARMTGKLMEPLPELYKGTSPSASEFAALYNQLSLPEEKTNFPDSVWASLAENTISVGLNNDILFLKAKQNYKNEEIVSAVKQLTYLAQDSTEAGLRNRRTLGLWYLEQGLYDRAIDNFKASGDESSADVLKENNFLSHLLTSRLQQADELRQYELSKDTYESLHKKAPFNEFLTADIAGYLEENGMVNEAYTMVFEALEFNDKSVLLWQKYVLLAVKNGVDDYAHKGLDKLETLMPDDEFSRFYASYEDAKKSFQQEINSF